MVMLCCVVFCKQKTAYEMRISDWSSDVCSSDFVRSLPLEVGRERHWQQLVHDDLADMLMDLLTLWSEICRIDRALEGRAVLDRELAGQVRRTAAFPLASDVDHAARSAAGILDRKSTRLNSSH